MTNLGTTLIHGPVTEVGRFVVQLAKARGAVVAAVTPPGQAALARALGADVVIPEDANPREAIQAVRDFFGGGVDNAIHLAGDPSVAAGVVRTGGKFTSAAEPAIPSLDSAGEYIPTVVAPSGHKLADLLFKVAARRLHSNVGRTYSFDQVGDAVHSVGGNASGGIVLVR
jgi:NADPH:quinone reductase-like Zn-dependent oxidoreductase